MVDVRRVVVCYSAIRSSKREVTDRVCVCVCGHDDLGLDPKGKECVCDHMCGVCVFGGGIFLLKRGSFGVMSLLVPLSVG